MPMIFSQGMQNRSRENGSGNKQVRIGTGRKTPGAQSTG
jgi:hypothetical protein